MLARVCVVVGAVVVRQLQHRLGYSTTSNLVAEYELKLEMEGLHPAFMDKVLDVHKKPWSQLKDSQLAEDYFSAALHALTGEARYLADAVRWARQEPVTPWMGADTANHYQWYPFHNNGHAEAWERASAAQIDLYRRAREQIACNLELVRPGLALREFSEKAWRLPERCRANRYSAIAHGVGVCDEYPAVYYPEDVAVTGYDGVLEPGMTICIESYIGETGGAEGVKLEEQVLVTETGAELLSRYPFEDEVFG